jgi:hypothetical protein
MIPNTAIDDSSCAGLTRASISENKNQNKKMDRRVEPGDDAVDMSDFDTLGMSHHVLPPGLTGSSRGMPDDMRLAAGLATMHRCHPERLVAHLKANPNKLSVGIAGVGATGHLAGIAFQKETGTRFQFVPYRGNAPAMQDLAAGNIDFMIEPASNFQSLVRAGRLKPYAITAKARLETAPDIPTADEAGVPGFSASLWYGLWVPKDTQKEIIARLNAVMMETLADPATRKRFAELGIAIAPRDQQTPEALRAFQKAEADRWWPIIKAGNIKGQ